MNKLLALGELFDAQYGVNLELVNVEECSKNEPDSIRFVSRTETNNGVSAYVKKIEDVAPNPAKTISVAVSGSVLSSFYQDAEYYSGRDIYFLVPKRKMSVEELLFYAHCIKANKYKYNYGRGANKTLRQIMLPAEMPKEFSKVKVGAIHVPSSNPALSKEIILDTSKWQWFEIQELFEVKKGKRLTQEDMTEGTTPFIGAIDSNNGYRDFVGQEPNHTGNTITVNYNGSVAEAFYQAKPYFASDDVNVLYPKFEMNPRIALFIATIIENEKYRFNYGRKWHVERMNSSKIKLPVKGGEPDFQFMERFIQSLRYSSTL